MLKHLMGKNLKKTAKLGEFLKAGLMSSTLTSYLAISAISGFLLVDAATMQPTASQQKMHASAVTGDGRFVFAFVHK